jgi:hypothetical protein
MSLFSSPAQRGRGTTHSVVEGALAAQAPSVTPLTLRATSPAAQGRRRGGDHKSWYYGAAD